MCEGVAQSCDQITVQLAVRNLHLFELTYIFFYSVIVRNLVSKIYQDMSLPLVLIPHPEARKNNSRNHIKTGAISVFLNENAG